MAGEDHKLQVGFGKFSLAAQGMTTIIIIVLLANVFALVWAGRTILESVRNIDRAIAAQTVDLQKTIDTQSDQLGQEHHRIVNEIDKLMCLQTLSHEDQQKFRASPGGWSKWCWWVEDNGKRKD